MSTIQALGTNSDKGYTSQALSPEEAVNYWPEFEKLVMDGLRYSQGELLPSDIKRFLAMGAMHSFVAWRDNAVEMLMIAEVVKYPRFKSMLIVVLAGKNLKDAKRFFPSVENWALMMGCTKIEAYTQPQHCRLFARSGLGFSTVYQMIRKDIMGKLQ